MLGDLLMFFSLWLIVALYGFLSPIYFIPSLSQKPLHVAAGYQIVNLLAFFIPLILLFHTYQPPTISDFGQLVGHFITALISSYAGYLTTQIAKLDGTVLE